MAINEWYEDALRRKSAEQMANEAIKTARDRLTLKCWIDKALDERDAETFYALTNQLRGME
jgi:uncharacterized protein YpiB (UPF0302 family)